MDAILRYFMNPDKSLGPKVIAGLAAVVSLVAAIVGIVWTVVQIYAKITELRSKRKEKIKTPLANALVTNLPQRNPHFTGREEIFAAIENGFKENSALALTQTIAGLGGVGKSQTVLEYAYRHLTDYADAVWWVNAETSLTEDCRRLLLRFDYPTDKDHYDTQAVLPALHTWYAEHHDWLLILDNAKDYDKLEPWLPKNSKGHVLITTRDAKAFPQIQPIDLDVFPEETALNFLRERIGRMPDNHAKALAEKLGYLPLALELAAAYMKEKGKSYEDYLALLERQGLRLLERSTPLFYQQIITETWKATRENLSPAAKQLLTMCAYLAPDNFPMQVFYDAKNNLPSKLRKAFKDELDREDVIAELTRFSFLKTSDNCLYSMHRLVQQVIRRDANDEASCYAAVLNIITAALPKEFSTDEAYVQLALLGYHAISVLDNPAQAYVKGNMNVRTLIAAKRNDLAQHLGVMSMRNYLQQHGQQGRGI